MEDLDGPCRDPRLDLLAQQLERHRVEMLGDLDMVVEADPASLPVGVLIGSRRQWQQRGAVELLEQRLACRVPATHRAIVDVSYQLADGTVQLSQGEETPVAQPRQNPALNHLDANLDFRLVARLVCGRAGMIAVP